MKGKKYSIEFKKQIVKEVQETGNATIVARRHNLVPGTVNRWVRESKQLNKMDKKVKYYDIKNVTELSKENEQLKKLLGEKDLEIAILRDLLKKTTQR